MTTPSDILESKAYHDNKTEVACHECGAVIDTEQDTYYVSRDGARFCCCDCDGDITRLSSIHYSSGEWGASAEFGKGLDCVEVSVLAKSQPEALKKAEEYGDIINEGVNCYLEVE